MLMHPLQDVVAAVSHNELRSTTAEVSLSLAHFNEACSHCSVQFQGVLVGTNQGTYVVL